MTDSTQSSTTTLPLVTLWETHGSGAEVIGPRLAEALGLTFFGQAFSSEQIEEEADAARSTGPFDRFLAGFAGDANLTADGGLATLRANAEADHAAKMENIDVVQQQSAAGGVMLGRNGTVILADRPNTLHVKLDGPLEERVARAVERLGITHRQAERRARHEDEIRSGMSRKLHHWDPRDNDHYDLVVNTMRFSEDGAVRIILAALEAKTGYTVAPRT
jgi:cytidylate kinase